MKGIMITYYDGQKHKAGPFRSVMFDHITQSIPAITDPTVTYYCETDDGTTFITVPLTHTIEAKE